ncbi:MULTISPECIES: 50S ribosomal protein L24 [unclassified Candidatus Tisiphia]|uniref:50S ribosomal protein L24 n=1 Tax=unclassified Candidatus Tisiphia TaxID=2996318 RepID=UPI00312CA689
MIKLKIKKGDEVIVITGKNKGKRGKVLKVFPEQNRAIVSGVNIARKHVKPSKTSEGGIVSKELSIDISNVAHIDPKTGNPTKIAFKFLEDGSKVRVAKKSGEIISKEGK